MTATARRPSISGRYSIPDTFDYPSQMMFDGRPTLTTSVAEFTKGRPRYASSFCCAAPWNYEYGQSPQEYTIGNMRESTVLDKKCTRPTNVTGICKVRNNSPRVRHHSRTSGTLGRRSPANRDSMCRQHGCARAGTAYMPTGQHLPANASTAATLALLRASQFHVPFAQHFNHLSLELCAT